MDSQRASTYKGMAHGFHPMSAYLFSISAPPLPLLRPLPFPSSKSTLSFKHYTPTCANIVQLTPKFNDVKLRYN